MMEQKLSNRLSALAEKAKNLRDYGQAERHRAYEQFKNLAWDKSDAIISALQEKDM